jgi:Zn-dependent metalloprotease
MNLFFVAIATVLFVTNPVHSIHAFAAVSQTKDQLISLSDEEVEGTFIGVTEPQEVARQFLLQNAKKLGLNSELNDLQLESVIRTPVGFHVRYQQMYNGMAVYAANVVVTLSKRLGVVTYVNSYQPVITEAVLAPRLKNTEAVRAAYGFLKLTASPRRQQVIPMILVKNGKPSVIYRSRINAPVDKKYSWEILTDAETNEVLYAKDITMNQNAQASVFVANPVLHSGKKYGDGWNDANNGDLDIFNKALSTVELRDMEKSNGIYTFSGKYVQITDHEAPKNPECKTSNGQMFFSRSKPCFNATMVYYHIDQSMRYLNETLGVKVGPFQYRGGVKADPKGLNGDDNSHYDPSSGELAFGEGGVDDAQDHDVILHELGHGLHDWVTHGHLSQNQGLSEGSGDYWAMSYSRQFMKPGHVAYHWTFSFDGHNEFWPGRVTNVAGNYPTAASGGIHAAGQLWATTCMMVWDAIGKEKTDKIFWSALGMLNESSTQADAANAFVKATQEIAPSDRARVVQIFKSKGYPVQ